MNKDQLDIIKKRWENYKIDHNIEKVNLNNIQSTVPMDHPYRHMLFNFIPKDEDISWNECSPSPDQDCKKFVEFLQSEYSVDNSVRLIDFIVASAASAKQAFTAALLEEAHFKKRKNTDIKGLLIAILGKPGTGKSHAFTQILEPYLKARKETDTLRKGAFTGGASLNINTLTLHSQLGLSIVNDVKDITRNWGNMNISENKRDKINAWRSVLSLMIDEISQIAAILLSQICTALCFLKECRKIFGNLNMFFFGDFYQMESIAPSLFRTLNESNQNKIN